MSGISCSSLGVFDLQIVLLQPSVGVAGVVVIDHPSDVGWVVPEVAEPP